MKLAILFLLFGPIIYALAGWQDEVWTVIPIAISYVMLRGVWSLIRWIV